MVDPIIFTIIAFLGGSLGVKVISTKNPVYSGLYLVLLFILGSAISFLLGLEFMGLLFLLVYAGAIAVLVLFVVMMLDVKVIESAWSSKKKTYFYLFICSLIQICAVWGVDLPLRLVANSGRWFFALSSTEQSVVAKTSIYNTIDYPFSLGDLSYTLYTTHAILLVISGIILLISMVGAITLTLQTPSQESSYRQLGRESKNAVFLIKDRPQLKSDSRGSFRSLYLK
uniref:NADH-ubiquinone oxidoreductase chain 6 n=1 Tax=Phaeophyceae sp. TaxID=2249243 RepID=A0A8E8PFG6_9PHAE|nr:Nad6 [Phaeophyceae sp.]